MLKLLDILPSPGQAVSKPPVLMKKQSKDFHSLVRGNSGEGIALAEKLTPQTGKKARHMAQLGEIQAGKVRSGEETAPAVEIPKEIVEKTMALYGGQEERPSAEQILSASRAFWATGHQVSDIKPFDLLALAHKKQPLQKAEQAPKTAQETANSEKSLAEKNIPEKNIPEKNMPEKNMPEKTAPLQPKVPQRSALSFNKVPLENQPIPEVANLNDSEQRLLRALHHYRPAAKRNS